MKNIFYYKFNFLWAPFWLALGIIFFDQNIIATDFHYAGILAIMCLVIGYFWRYYMIFALFFFALGVMITDYRWQNIVDTQLVKGSNIYFIDGNISGYGGTNDNPYIIVKINKIDTIDKSPQFHHSYIRLKSDNRFIDTPLNCKVSIKALLFPYEVDIKQTQWIKFYQFQGIIAHGKILDYNIDQSDHCEENFANRVNKKKKKDFPPDIAAFVIALTTGHPHALNADQYKEFQLSGLSHILSISGLHMGIIAGFFFFLIRRGLIIFFPYASSLRLKKITAFLVMIIIGSYGLIIDPSAAMMRSLIMIAFVLSAIIFDRNPFSLRILAFAFIMILLFQPMYLFTIGFQFSFLSLLAIIGLYQAYSQKIKLWTRYNLPFPQIFEFLWWIFLAGIIVFFINLPLVLFYFTQISWLALIANALIIPLFDFLTMPLIMIKFLTLPLVEYGDFSWLDTAIITMITLIRTIVHYINSFDGLIITISAVNPYAVALWCFTAYMIAVAENKYKFMIGFLLFLFFCYFFQLKPPVFITNSTHKIWALKIDDDQWISNKYDHYIHEEWKRKYGINDFTYVPLRGHNPPVYCNNAQCTIRALGKTYFFHENPHDAHENALRKKFPLP